MSMTIMVPDALAAVENNLKAILTLAKDSLRQTLGASRRA